MNYQEKISKIQEKIKNKEFEVAEQDLLNIITEEEFKTIEDEKNLHFSFYNYIEILIYWRKFQPSKKILSPDNNIADVYYMLGFINFETKNYGRAVQYLDKALEWNPVSPRIRMEKADTLREMKEYERYRIEIEKSYQYIYDSIFMSKYYRELGWYYSEKRVYNIANALFTQSIAYMDTDFAKNELIYIAQQENREPRFSTQDEIKKLFKEYNIPLGISNEVTQIIYNDLQQLLKENNIELANYLYRTLYDITHDERFMLYVNLKDDKTGITVRVPEIWKKLNKEAYSKFGISDNTIFLFITPRNEKISIVCDGKCEPDQFDQAYKINIENMKKQGINIEGKYTTRGKKNINQVFTLVQTKEKPIRILQNYLVVNGYFLNVSWEVPNNIPLENLLNENNNSLKMQMIFSLKGDIQGMNKQETNKKASEENPIFSAIKDEFNINGITEKNVDLLQKLAIQFIKQDELDPYWSDLSRDVFKLLIFSNLINNKEFTLPDLVVQTQDVEMVKDIINKNIDKLDVPELQKTMTVKQILSSDKPLKSVVEIIHKAVLPLINQATETLKKEEKSTQSNKKNVKPIIVKCFACNYEFKLNWNVPASEETFYCKCPNCNAEIKSTNPNYKG